MFRPLPSQLSFPNQELEILDFWKRERIYEKSLEQRAGSRPFVFYEGPPTANGMPHPGHCLTRAIKDLFPRYRTMRGYHCERKAGWDTHGLPVEVEVCRELGIHAKEEIESYGVEPFIQLCQQSVWRYMQQWERLTERLGFWIHLDEAYVTYHQSYVESVWWALAQLFDRGLLYQGHKIVWWWAQGGTALSSGEVGQGYREVADPSVYVRFPLLDDSGKETDTSLLVWTTTPWTLPSNQFAAVHPELTYATVSDPDHPGQKLILAKDLVETIAGKVKRELTVESTCQGRELVGRRYVPPFDYYHKTLGDVTGELKAGGTQHVAWRITTVDFVTIDSGTGAVHEAPAFGEVDYDLLLEQQQLFVDGQGPDLICAVAPDGKFTAEAGEYAGRWVKDCDKDITRELRQRGLLYHQEQYLHDYPFCWRAEQDPLIQYPRRSWFVRTTKFKDAMLANNRQINWLPEHIRDGRFGNFLESNVDWALSRERYWGTPLPIWVCEMTGQMEAVSSYEQLLAKPGVSGTEVWQAAKAANPDLVDDLQVHKPYIDAVTYDSPFADGARMQRVSEVIDCWFDSGAMPFAQWGYPHQGREDFERQFPADFISEAIDQTRGWFYSLLAISTLVFGDDESTPPDQPDRPWPHPFRNCIVHGLMLSEWWESKDAKQVFLSEPDALEALGAGKFSQRVGKMSKSKRNYREPTEIFDRYGADALRWYFFANQAPWNSIIYSEQAIKESIPEFLLRLWNVYKFLVTYAPLDEFDPAAELTGPVDQLTAEELSAAESYRPASERSELDRWLLGELAATVQTVTESMDAYDNYPACRRILDFVDGLSNWWTRRSRPRFWSKDKRSQDKLDAYWTLYETLLTTTKLIAPFTPFVAESMWQNLAVSGFAGKVRTSVHLCDYPEPHPEHVNDKLSRQMTVVRELASLALSARMGAKLKVRQPLAKVEIILVDPSHQQWLEGHCGLIAEELNVKAVEFTSVADEYINYSVLPNLKRLGPRLGKQLPVLKKLLAEVDAAALYNQLEQTGTCTLELPEGPLTLERDDILVRLEAKPGWAAAQGPHGVVVLATQITPELHLEGLAREVVHAIQSRRKDLDCEYNDTIRVALVSDSEELTSAVELHSEYIAGETLAREVGVQPLSGVEPVAVTLAGHEALLFVEVVE